MTVSRCNHKQAFDLVNGNSDRDNANHWNAHGAVNEAAVEKHAKCCKWQIHKEDVIALAFSTYKATAKETLQFFKNLGFNLGDGDTERTTKVLRERFEKRWRWSWSKARDASLRSSTKRTTQGRQLQTEHPTYK
jgi:hypothetical protein